MPDIDRALRSFDEIHRAHDLVIGILIGEAPNPYRDDPIAMKCLTGAADVLCWVLNHDHNKTFSVNLAKLEAFTKEQGFVLGRVDS